MWTLLRKTAAWRREIGKVPSESRCCVESAARVSLTGGGTLGGDVRQPTAGSGKG